MADAIIDALKIKNPKIFIKPPNDIMVRTRDEGRRTRDKKIAGILTESSVTCDKIDWIVIGVGVNINNKIPKGLKNISTCDGGIRILHKTPTTPAYEHNHKDVKGISDRWKRNLNM